MQAHGPAYLVQRRVGHHGYCYQPILYNKVFDHERWFPGGMLDEYMSAMPVDIFKKMNPKTCKNMPHFYKLDEL